MNRSKIQTTRNRLSGRTNFPASTTTSILSTIENNPIDPSTRSKNIRQNSRAISKNRQTNIIEPISNDNNNDDDDNWICPVAVVLRQAGYDVPLRPSKSWLERDRQKQALLSTKKQMSAKKI